MADCVHHPGVAEVARCDGCGQAVCANCFVVLAERRLCGTCKADAVRRIERGARLEGRARSPSPWERDPSLATLRETLWQVLASPREFFSGLALEGDGYWSYVISFGWPSAALGALLGHFFPILGQRQSFMGDPANVMVLVALVVLAPLQIVLGIAIQGGIVHMFLRALGAATGRLETTIRTTGYAQSVLIFNWVPILGPLVGAVWMVVLLVIGVREMHGTTTGRALAAVLMPMLLCVVPVLAIVILGVLAGMNR